MPDTNLHPAVDGRTAAAPFAALEGTHWIESLRDGTRVLIRPLAPEDREREADFIERLSPDARRWRFLGSFRRASPALIDQLMDVDYRRQMAFVALAHVDGQLREVGASRYSEAGSDRRCECAVAVADEWQHRGLGVLLMRHLITIARKNGYRQMFSVDAAENEAMHALGEYLGFQRRIDPDDAAQVIHTLDL
ncbi:MAG: GNAT family N-acetyltransferase [Xanthomonadaceae bacterium]|jgi:GNAT superfamily N-acetyltransferase|nr:GNAT family N-acetyltransferase [Xanthomonadaceae bacterium]MDE3072667.1 GNAT family N-acetyltransferase [Pseudomonadota bacterium]